MNQPAKQQPPANTAPEPAPPYRRIYAWVFQAWMLMFLGVVCVSLLFYLLSYIPQ